MVIPIIPIDGKRLRGESLFLMEVCVRFLTGLMIDDSGNGHRFKAATALPPFCNPEAMDYNFFDVKLFGFLKKIALPLVLAAFLASGCGDGSLHSKTQLRALSSDGYVLTDDLPYGDYRIQGVLNGHYLRIGSEHVTDTFENGAGWTATVLCAHPYERNGRDHPSDGVIDTRQIITLGKTQGEAKYLGKSPCYLSAPADAAGRFTAGDIGKNGCAAVKYPLGSAVSDEARRLLYTEYNANADTYRFFYRINETNYYIAYGKTDDSSNLLVAEESQFPLEWYDRDFRLEPVCGDYSLPSRLYVNDEGPFSTKCELTREVERYVSSTTSKAVTSKISKPYSFGVKIGNQSFFDRATNSFKIRYDDLEDFKLTYNYTYQSWHKDYGFLWANGSAIEGVENGYTYTIQNIPSLAGEEPVKTGRMGLEYYDASIDDYRTAEGYSYVVNGNYQTEIKFDWASLLKTTPTLFRSYFYFSVYGKNSNNKGNYKEVMLVSEPFYASIYGIGQGSAAPAIVQSGGYEEEASFEGDYDFENGLISGVTDVLNGSLVKGHIDVDPVLRKSGYKTYVAKENGRSPDPDQMGSYEEVYSKTTFIGDEDYRAEGYPEGHYQIKTTGNGEETEIDCYIFNDIQDFFFGGVFAQSKQPYDQKSHKYFVNGDRVLMSPGIDIGFDIPYSDLLYPTYVGEVSLRATKYLSKASSLSISVTHTGFDGTVTTSNYSDNVFASDYDVSTPGLYEIEIATVYNAQSGYNPSFRIRFYILGGDAKPLVNYYRALYGVNSKSDYISTVYTVDLGIKLCRPYLNYTAEIHDFTDIYLNRDFDNSLIYKEDIPVTLLFADYSSALSYALSFGKQNVEKIGDDQFVIGGDMSTIYDEVAIYRELLDYAKTKVQKTYTYLLPEDELLGFHVEGNRYIVANGDNYYMDTEPMPRHVYLTPSVQEREKLLSRDFINDFVFANDRNHLYAEAVDIYREGNDGEWIFVKTYDALSF